MGKQYAILRVQKCKGAAIGAMQYHNDREPGNHTNPDIDQSRTRLNREMCPHADYEGEIQAKIDEGYSGARKVRKDAVMLVEGIVTASPEFFEGSSDEKVREFFDDAYKFCCNEFGESNMVHFTVHMDEETPHAHFGFVPLRDGKLSWKEFFPSKMALREMQDRFHGRVGALYGLSRGEKRKEGEPAKRHKSVAEYKAESRRVQAEIDEQSERLECLRREVGEVEKQIAELESPRESIFESARAIVGGVGVGERERAAKADAEAIASELGRVKAETEQLEDGMPELESRVEGLRGAVARAFEKVERLAKEITGAIYGIGEEFAGILRSLGVDAHAEEKAGEERGDYDVMSEARDARKSTGIGIERPGRIDVQAHDEQVL